MPMDIKENMPIMSEKIRKLSKEMLTIKRHEIKILKLKQYLKFKNSLSGLNRMEMTEQWPKILQTR